MINMEDKINDMVFAKIVHYRNEFKYYFRTRYTGLVLVDTEQHRSILKGCLNNLRMWMEIANRLGIAETKDEAKQFSNG